MHHIFQSDNIWLTIGITAGILVAAALVIWGLLRLNRFVFRRLQSHYEGLHLLFFRRVSGAVILVGGVIFVFALFGGVDSIWKSLLGGTAIISAVLAFAAQDVIKDILAGLMISLHKPFEIGNRIELEDGTVGIVRDMTMRHIVLLGIDTQYSVIPNSKLNLMKIKNYSYHVQTRSANFNFYVAYHCDVERAMDVIRTAVIASPYSIPGKETADGAAYADIYFMAYEDSRLRLTTTVYYGAETASEVLISDINSRVNRALRENDMEIPYPYINVIAEQKNDSVRQYGKI